MRAIIILIFATCALAIPLRKRQWQAPSTVPTYVLEYAPIVYLHPEESYMPADIGSQLTNTRPEVNFIAIPDAPNPLTLDNLNQMHSDVYMTSSNSAVVEMPTWLYGVAPDARGKTNSAITCAIIVRDHGDGLVDAFYMYFYAYDRGAAYVGFILGNHVGDWEHNMIRFKDGVPQAVWYSQHSNGEAFDFNTVLKYKDGVRPIVFTANGTHANYAIPGTHGFGIPDLNLPFGPLLDHTDYGTLWDPTLSAYYYSYDAESQHFDVYDRSTPANWLYFSGAWGDEQYHDSDPRQESVLGIKGLYKYVSGPTGPVDKQLAREKMCPDNGYLCIVRSLLVP